MAPARTLALVTAALGIVLAGGCARPDTATQNPNGARGPQAGVTGASAAPAMAPPAAPTAGTRWQDCPLGDLDSTAEGALFDFPASDVFPSDRGPGQRDVLVVRLTTAAGPLYQHDPSFEGRSTGEPIQPWLTYQGADEPEPAAWDRIFSGLAIAAPDDADRSTIYLASENFTEDEHVWLAASSEPGEPVACAVTRLSVERHTILAMSSFELRPGGFGPIQVGITGDELVDFGVVDRVGDHWVNTDALAERGIFFAAKGSDDWLYQIDVIPGQGVPVAGLGVYFDEHAIPDNYRAFHLETLPGDSPEAKIDKWVMFDDGGALTLWVGADGLISRASATAGTDLATYQSPQSGM